MSQNEDPAEQLGDSAEIGKGDWTEPRNCGWNVHPLAVAVTEDGAGRKVHLIGVQITTYVRETSPGDRFLLCTDGALEASNEANEFFGEERLLKTMEEARTVGVEDFATSLLHDVGRWAGHDRGRPQEDDLTVLVVDCRSSTSE